MSSSSSTGDKKKRDQYTQINLFQAFNGRLARPAANTSGAQRNTSNGTTSRYFNNNNDNANANSTRTSRPVSYEDKYPRRCVADRDEMEGVRFERPEDDEASRLRRRAGRGKREIITDPKSGRYHNEAYMAVARENIEISKVLLPYLFFDPAQKPDGYLYDSKDVQKLGASYCPGYSDDEGSGRKGCRVRIVNGDTYDVACEMLERHMKEQAATYGDTGGDSQMSMMSTTTEGDFVDNGPVVLNLANQKTRGGGWRKGCMAQEEELCYRSTLHASLPRKFYPLSDTEGVYSPFVAIIRSRCTENHQLYPLAEFIYETHTANANALITKTPPSTPLPVVSVITIAAVRDPELKTVASVVGDGEERERYRNPSDRYLMKTKIRLMLRMAALNGHRRLVLGALGCGAFNNPKEEVIELFKAVFAESEFSGGWWKEVVFAVLDTEQVEAMKGKDGGGNYGVFSRGLDGFVA